MNSIVFPQINMPSPIPQCDGLWLWKMIRMIRFRWDHDDGDLMMGLVPLWEEAPQSLLTLFSPCEDSGKAVAYKAGRKSSPENNHAGMLTLNSVLQNSETIHYCCLSHSICGTVWHPKLRQYAFLKQKYYLLKN